MTEDKSILDALIQQAERLHQAELKRAFEGNFV